MSALRGITNKDLKQEVTKMMKRGGWTLVSGTDGKGHFLLVKGDLKIRVASTASDRNAVHCLRREVRRLEKNA